MIPDKAEIEAIGKTDATKALVVGNEVYDPLIFAPGFVHFSRKQYLFLHHYRLGVPLADAAFKADISIDSAERFLTKPDTVAWLRDRAQKDHIRNEWQEPGKWWAMGDEVLDGKRHLSKDQQVVFAMFGDRVCPKAMNAGESKQQITINIDPGAVQEAFRRQKSIEAEIVDERKTA